MDLFNGVRDRQAGRIGVKGTARNGCAIVSRWAVETGTGLAGIGSWGIEDNVLTRRGAAVLLPSE
jgi:hypothetical protein